MKRLIFMRHGKSDWDADYGSDRERPLNARGERAAAAMGRLLSAAGEIPDVIVSSPAVRARTTAELAREAGGWATSVDLEDALYGASPGEVISIIADHGGNAHRLMVVGHEPTTSQTIAVLSGGRVRVATATAVGLDIGDWERLQPGSATLAYVLPPRLFP
jgi:phosphohistidine phosphatase